MAVLTFIASAVTLTGTGTTRSLSERTRADQYLAKQDGFYAAEAGLIQAMADVRDQLSITGQFPEASSDGTLAITAPTLTRGATFEDFEVTYDLDGDAVADPAVQGTLTTGQFAGMQATSRTVRITSEVSGISGISTRLSTVMTLSVIPVFQFAMFDHDDFSFRPGTTTTITGPVFSNGTLSLHPSGNVTIDGTVRAAGDIIHAENNNSGNVNIKAADGVFRNMKNADSSWLESTDATWDADSQARWGGTVTAHVDPLQFPTPEGEATIEIIKPGEIDDSEAMQSMRMYYQADIRIMDGVATDANGNLVSLPSGTVTTTSFYDDRENDEACAVDLDVEKLKDSGLANGKIVYVGSTLAGGPSCFNAVRVVNGGQLPAGGLTVVTHHPIYVKGDYNYSTATGATKQPAALIGDALTVLSGNWDDANSTMPRSARLAADTRVYAGVMAGRAREPGSEHLIRFLENWAGRTFMFTGAESSPWESDEVSDLLDTSAYSPPTRIWAFDTTFMTGFSPPGTPVVYTLTNAAWYQE